MVSEDAFYLSHTVEPVDVPAAGRGRRVPSAPGSPGPSSSPGDRAAPWHRSPDPDHYVEFRHATVADAMRRVPERLRAVERGVP